MMMAVPLYFERVMVASSTVPSKVALGTIFTWLLFSKAIETIVVGDYQNSTQGIIQLRTIRLSETETQRRLKIHMDIVLPRANTNTNVILSKIVKEEAELQQVERAADFKTLFSKI
mmetsp:Transcript_10688/g.25722  ORF Transcript_10688/g.25722 Transcript_10688/m.25722 type:complete len:116 (+) Transcript_10688:1305-1652(+)